MSPRTAVLGTSLCLAVVLLVTAPGALFADVALGGTPIGMGARAAALGGAHVAIAEDATALYYNPAGLTQISRTTWNSGFVGGVNDLDVLTDTWRLVDTVSSETGADTLSPADFDRLRRQVGDLSGRPLELTASAYSALAFRNVALGGYALGSGSTNLARVEGAGPEYQLEGITVREGERLSAEGDALWQYSYGAGLAHQFTPRLAVGVTVRQMTLAYVRADWRAEAAGQSLEVTNSNSPVSSEAQITADLGLLYQVEPGITAALVARNLTAPRFTLDDGTQGFRLRAEPSVDVGLVERSADGRHLFTLDVHNLLSANDLYPTAHVGYEWQAGRSLALRAGAGNHGVTFGAGLRLGSVGLDLASGEKLGELVALSTGWIF